jgi:hypothetical protein
MERYIHAARWFPLSINPFVNLGAVLNLGMAMASDSDPGDTTRYVPVIAFPTY